MNISFPKIEEIRAIRSDSVASAEAEKAIQAVADLAKHLHPATIAAIAKKKHPKLDLLSAVQKFSADISQLVCTASAHSDAAESLWLEELERIKPISHRAFLRFAELPNLIAGLRKEILHAHTDRNAAVQRLLDSGVRPDAAEKIIPPVNIEDKERILLSLQVEFSKFERFTKTYNVDDLPDGFAPQLAEQNK